MALASKESIYISKDSGNYWKQIYLYNNYKPIASIALSGNGKLLYAIANVSYLISSENLGSSWTIASTSLWNNVQTLASSESGQVIAGCSSTGVYVSVDAGKQTWCIDVSQYTNGSTVSSSTCSVALSGSGQYMYSSLLGILVSSYNYGVTWKVSSEIQGALQVSTDSSGAEVNVLAFGGAVMQSSSFAVNWTSSIIKDKFASAQVSTSDGEQTVFLANIAEGLYARSETPSKYNLYSCSQINSDYYETLTKRYYYSNNQIDSCGNGKFYVPKANSVSSPFLYSSNTCQKCSWPTWNMAFSSCD